MKFSGSLKKGQISKFFASQPAGFVKEIKCTWNNSCLDETLPNMAIVAQSVSFWLLPMESVRKAL
jgi:hypothetical protein